LTHSALFVVPKIAVFAFKLFDEKLIGEKDKVVEPVEVEFGPA